MDPLSYLFSLEHFGIKLGLDNISTLVARLGHPERAFRSIHIAGTNGKGSVTAMVDAAIRAAGHRSARYTSPHLVDLSERFVIDGRPVAREALIAALADVRDAAESLRADGSLAVQPTFFEVTTAVAFELFRRAGVETAVLEVGLGGRLDSTNVVSPIATAITSIAFDHEQYLGFTLADIAFEKAGIIKPGVPVVVGDLAPEAAAVIARVARQHGAEIIQASATDAEPFAIGLRGRHQVINAAVAMRLLEVLNAQGLTVPRSAVARGLADPGWPGRLDLRRLPDGRELLLDAAHNPAGAAALASYLRERRPPLPLVFAAMRDKNIAGILAPLAPVIDSLIVTRASNPRSADPSAIVGHARAVAPSLVVSIAPSPAEALALAWRKSPAIVVAGSIFLLGDVLSQVGGS
ncbi:MAG: bifunctional folylpolyglutamate synthase/dihydrofolate synthase [Acidobacteria bacterium]|nr:bifunctional folylpolyglutamate synthase/dihydrofolate synthase [Acidobacteriota bacterium]